MIEKRHNDDVIIEKLDALDLRIQNLEERMSPIDDLKGFWKVVGFVCGGLAVISAGIAGIVFIWHLIQNIANK